MPMLSLQNISKDYLTDGQRVPALKGLSLNVGRGEFVALVGRSGCGKSTLLNLAGAMDFPTSGTVLLDGVATSSLKDTGLTQLRREKIGFIFQSFREAARERLAWVGLDGLGERYAHQLSGGQMQRVAIARALIHSPGILLADEPTGNLDTITGNVILQLLRRLTREQNTASIVATHSLEAASLADTVVKLRDGKIEQIIRR